MLLGQVFRRQVGEECQYFHCPDKFSLTKWRDHVPLNDGMSLLIQMHVLHNDCRAECLKLHDFVHQAATKTYVEWSNIVTGKVHWLHE